MGSDPAGRPAPPGRISGRSVYRGNVLDVHLDRVVFPDGSEGDLEIIRHRGAVAVVPVYRPGERPRGTGATVVLLRQYRYAAGGFLWEVPAGKLDDGEDPERCARRELEEEAGLRAGELRPLTAVYTTPGFTDERIHLFLALDLEPGQAGTEPGEFIEPREVAVGEALELIRTGAIVDAKTICALLYAARFCERELGTG